MMSKADLAVTGQESDAKSRLFSILTSLIAKLDGPDIAETGIIPWAAPIPVFGDLCTSRVATVGLNPSNREFVDEDGIELTRIMREGAVEGKTQEPPCGTNVVHTTF